MAILWDLIVLCLALFVLGIVNAITLFGGLFLLFKKLGPSDEHGAHDFSNTDKKATQEVIVRTVIQGLGTAAAAVIVAYLLYKSAFYFRRHEYIAALPPAVATYAAAYFLSAPIQKIEPKRALILAAFPTLLYLILHPTVLAGIYW